MQSFGVRRTLVYALLLMGGAGRQLDDDAVLAFRSRWGLPRHGSGCIATVLAATIVGRWFATHRGTVMGLLTASTATGTLIFLPVLAALAEVERLAGGGADAFGQVLRARSVYPAVAARMAGRRRSRALWRSAGPASPPPQPRRDPVKAAARMPGQGRPRADLLAARGDLLHLRLHDQRPRRHASHRFLRRPRHCGSAGGGASRGDGNLRPRRHDGIGLADRSFRSAQIAVRLLRRPRPVAALSAVFRISRSSACRSLPCSTASTGSPRSRRRCGSRPRPSEIATARSSSAGSSRDIRSALRVPPSSPALLRVVEGRYLEAFLIAGSRRPFRRRPGARHPAGRAAGRRSDALKNRALRLPRAAC